MLFQILVLLVVLLMTTYLATQGWLSATMIFISATFASILAGGLYEPVSGLFSFSPVYQRGMAYLALFLVAFGVLRFAADRFVRENVTLQIWVDRAGGGVVGLLTALIITGTIVNGIAMMPLRESILGWNRFDGGPQEAERKLWLHNDDFVTWIYEMTLGRSMGGSYGGDYTFAQAHPDFGRELWGLRHTVQLASQSTLQPKLLQPVKAWATGKGDDAAQYVIRTSILKEGGGGLSEDKDHYFRASTTEVRLVGINKTTGEAMQAYPEGFMDKGVTLLRFGNDEKDPKYPYMYVQEDYTDPPAEQVTVDYVFTLKPGFDPAFIEIKGLARRPIELEAAALPPVVADYPPRHWEKEQFRMTVQAHDAMGPIANMEVWIVPYGIKKSAVDSMMVKLADTLEANQRLASASPTGPYVPIAAELNSPTQIARNAHLENQDSTELAWNSIVIPPVLWASLEPTGQGLTNSRKVQDALIALIRPKLNDTKVAHLTTDKAGVTDQKSYLASQYCMVAWYMDSKNTLFVWYPQFPAEQRKIATFTLTTAKEAAKQTNDNREFTPDFVWPRR